MILLLDRDFYFTNFKTEKHKAKRMNILDNRHPPASFFVPPMVFFNISLFWEAGRGSNDEKDKVRCATADVREGLMNRR